MKALKRDIFATTDGGRPRGFTLIELILVMTIILLLVAILAPTVPDIIDRAKAKQAEIMIDNLSTGLNAYKQTYGSYPLDNLLKPDGSYNTDKNPTKEYVTGAMVLYAALQGPNGTGWRSDDRDEEWRANVEFGPVMSNTEASTMPHPRSGKTIFKDPFGNQVLYYSAYRGGELDLRYITHGNIRKCVYWPHAARYPWDGQAGPLGDARGNVMGYSGAPKELDYRQHWVKKATKTVMVEGNTEAGVPYNQNTFMIWTAGIDGYFGYWSYDELADGYYVDLYGGLCDDVTNF